MKNSVWPDSAAGWLLKPFTFTGFVQQRQITPLSTLVFWMEFEGSTSVTVLAAATLTIKINERANVFKMKMLHFTPKDLLPIFRALAVIADTFMLDLADWWWRHWCPLWHHKDHGGHSVQISILLETPRRSKVAALLSRSLISVLTRHPAVAWATIWRFSHCQELPFGRRHTVCPAASQRNAEPQQLKIKRRPTLSQTSNYSGIQLKTQHLSMCFQVFQPCREAAADPDN